MVVIYGLLTGLDQVSNGDCLSPASPQLEPSYQRIDINHDHGLGNPRKMYLAPLATRYDHQEVDCAHVLLALGMSATLVANL